MERIDTNRRDIKKLRIGHNNINPIKFNLTVVKFSYHNYPLY